MSNENQQIVRSMQQGFRNILIFNLLFIIVWAMVVGLVPPGWWIALINILCFIVSLLILWWPSYSYLKVFLGGMVGFFVSALIWLALVVGVRSLILGMIDGVKSIPAF